MWSTEAYGVVLAAEEPDRSLDLLKKFSKAPLEAALNRLDHLTTTNCDWRNMSEISALGYEVLKHARNVKYPNDQGEALYWSGKRVTIPAIDKDFIVALWENKPDPPKWLYTAIRACVLGLP